MDGEALAPDYVQELRLFNENGEFYLWRDGEDFRGRLRIDQTELPKFIKPQDEKEGYVAPNSKLESPNFADEWQVLWGTQVEKENRSGWTGVYEARGAKFDLPHKLSGDPDTVLPLRLRVRHYIDYESATGLAYYADLRLVELREKNLKPIEWL
jgi:CRISPR-associated protein (TIGR03984 family)